MCDLDSRIRDRLDLADELSLDLLHRQAVEECANSQVARRAESPVAAHQRRDLVRWRERALLVVADEGQVHAEVELGVRPGELCRLSVAGIPGMIEALVSAPCSKHSIVARTVSSEVPKSSA